MVRENVKIINIRRAAFKSGVVTGSETERLCLGLGLPISKPKDIAPVSSSPSYEFAPKKIEITQSTQQAQSLDFREFEDGGGVFAARHNENYDYYTESLQGPLTLLPYQVRLTLREVNRVKINLKIPETISEEFEIEEPHEEVKIEEPHEEVEIEERDDITNNQIIEPTVTEKLPKPSCCVFSCSCLKKLFSRKSAKIGVSNKNLSVSLAIANDLPEVEADQKIDNNRVTREFVA